MANEQITADNLNLFTYTNIDICKKVEGIVLFFHGLGEQSLIKEANEEATYFANNNLLYVIPFYGPWAWMNNNAVKMIDNVIDIILKKFNLPPNIPIVSTGMSMGGLGALTFPRFTRHASKITAIAANCPVCDLIRLRETREDIPKSTYYAFLHYQVDMDEAVRTVSPIDNLKNAPKIPYFIAHCDNDIDVPKKEHSDIYVQKMKELRHDITYISVPDKGHVDLDEQALNQYHSFIIRYAKYKEKR